MSAQPCRVQMTRSRPWRREHPDAVIVARPSRWGNPFRVGREGALWAVRSSVPSLDLTGLASREVAVGCAVELFGTHLGPFGSFEESDMAGWLAPLRGRDLACWCPLDGSPCHADVLLAWANDRGAP